MLGQHTTSATHGQMPPPPPAPPMEGPTALRIPPSSILKLHFFRPGELAAITCGIQDNHPCDQ